MPEAAPHKIAKPPTTRIMNEGRIQHRIPCKGRFVAEEPSLLHLLLAGCWLILGVALLAWRWLGRSVSSVSLWESGSALGWFGVMMAFYNFLRWWLGRSRRTTSKQTRRPQSSP
jgi:hypothetical protein